MNSESEQLSWNRSNDGYTDASVISIRLDTGPMLDNLEAFLRGSRIRGYREMDDGSVIPVYDDGGTPKANREGIQSIMSWLSSQFNSHTVQGNMRREELAVFLKYLHQEIATDIMSKLNDYGIKEQDYTGIVNQIMMTAWMFFTRTIDNKERDSYGASMKTEVLEREKKGWNPFK